MQMRLEVAKGAKRFQKQPEKCIHWLFKERKGGYQQSRKGKYK